MRIAQVDHPKESLLFQKTEKYNYVDSFQGTILDEKNQITSLDVLKAFFSSGPKWITNLFVLRNKIVKLFGLKISQKISNKEEFINNLKGEPNEQIGLFKIFEVNEKEIIIGEDDKHLNFRVSLLVKPLENSHKQIIITTTVLFNNFFGKLYFLPVRLFHKKIVPAILKSILLKLKK